MRKLTHAELIDRQQHKKTSGRLPFVAVLNNIRSLYNVGSIFRTAEGAGLEKLWLCGITGVPPSGMISKTALGAEKEVPWEFRVDVCSVLEMYRRKGYTIVFLEQMVKSIPYQDYNPSGPICLVLGNEIQGVSEDLLVYCDTALEIEMAGVKNSLNVTVAFGIVAYHVRHQLLSLAANFR